MIVAEFSATTVAELTGDKGRFAYIGARLRNHANFVIPLHDGQAAREQDNDSTTRGPFLEEDRAGFHRGRQGVN